MDAWTAPRYPQSGGPFHEVWYVVGSDSAAGHGFWLRYTVDVEDEPSAALWAAWFDRSGAFALRESAAFGRSDFFAENTCVGEIDAGRHSLRWRLAFAPGAPAEDVVPRWLAPVAKLRGSGFVLPHPATTITGAIEVDGRVVDLRMVPGGTAHLWGRERYPSWAWGRCSAFAEDPHASLDVLDVEGPGGVRVPLVTFRFRNRVHHFATVPWIALSRSRLAPPAWHFSVEDATLRLDGVLRVAPERMVQVSYGARHHCINSEIADAGVRVFTRAFAGARWRPEATLSSKGGACLEFCGREPDLRVTSLLIEKQARRDGVVAS